MEIKGIPVIEHKWMALDTAYLVDMEGLEPRVQIVTDKVQTVAKDCAAWERTIEAKFLRDCKAKRLIDKRCLFGLHNLKDVNL